MGTDKAILKLGEQRLVDLLIDRYATKVDRIMLSAAHDYGTGLDVIPDDPAFAEGPAGAIFSVAARLHEVQPQTVGFVTVPVDAPFAPADLIERLSGSGACAVACDQNRIHPTFAYWRCDIIRGLSVARKQDLRSPSLHWIAEQTRAKALCWSDANGFVNINRPQDLIAAERHKKAGA